MKERNDKIWEPHDHSCEGCGTRWFHDPVGVIQEMLYGDETKVEQLNTQAHSCPSCERINYWIDDSGVPPQYLHDGEKTLPITERPSTVDTLETAATRHAAQIMCQMRKR